MGGVRLEGGGGGARINILRLESEPLLEEELTAVSGGDTLSPSVGERTAAVVAVVGEESSGALTLRVGERVSSVLALRVGLTRSPCSEMLARERWPKVGERVVSPVVESSKLFGSVEENSKPRELAHFGERASEEEEEGWLVDDDEEVSEPEEEEADEDEEPKKIPREREDLGDLLSSGGGGEAAVSSSILAKLFPKSAEMCRCSLGGERGNSPPASASRMPAELERVGGSGRVSVSSRDGDSPEDFKFRPGSVCSPEFLSPERFGDTLGESELELAASKSGEA